jgi:hypothetical protein
MRTFFRQKRARRAINELCIALKGSFIIVDDRYTLHIHTHTRTTQQTANAENNINDGD